MLRYQQTANIIELVLDSEATLNALTADMAARFLDYLHAWQDDPGVSCIVVRGAGDKAFCAGGDIQDLYGHLQARNLSACRDFFDLEYRLDHALYRYPKPIIAWVDGIVMGGGMGIMQGCRYRVVTEQVSMAMPETHIGLIPDVGSGDFLNQRPDRLPWLLALTGGRVSLAEVMYLGLADYYVPRSDYQHLIERLQHEEISGCLQQLRELPPTSILKSHQAALAAALSQSLEASLQVIAAIEEPIVQKLAQRMHYASPLALQATWRHLSECSEHVADDNRRALALQQEFDLVNALCRHGEFSEGIRALIIDKDRQPNWSTDRDFWFTESQPLNL